MPKEDVGEAAVVEEDSPSGEVSPLHCHHQSVIVGVEDPFFITHSESDGWWGLAPPLLI